MEDWVESVLARVWAIKGGAGDSPVEEREVDEWYECGVLLEVTSG